jgi:hypothetical protein
MTSKLDLKAISEYSNEFSHKIANEFFSKKDTITGGEILNISPIEQVNVFTIKSLFENWKATTEKFKSPFFDFENEKMKAALQDFMNIVSQNISVKKENLQPLLSKATSETLALTLNPLEYFDGILRDMPDFKCTKDDTNQLKKYIRINANLVDSFSKKFGDEEAVFTNQALNWMEELANSGSLDDADVVISQFSTVLNCEKNQFYKNKSAINGNESKEESTSFFDTIAAPEAKEEAQKPIEIKEVKTVEVPNNKVVEKEEPSNLNETYQTDQPTLNQHLTQNDNLNLADMHQNAPIKDLASSISLNQKFVFINKLFNGDSAAYNETLHILENCKDTDEAINLLKYKYAPKYQWNLNSDEADELIDILKRKA